jgi:phosphohistidine swiveling domain-containing protein
MSPPPPSRLLPLGDGIITAMLDEAAQPGLAGRTAGAVGLAGAKAARLARAAAAGLAVLPGWVVPVAECRAAVAAGAAAVRAGRPAAARRAVLGHRLDDSLAADLRAAVAGLGGRVIVRSSSPLESDPRWSGAFSSVAEVGPDDIGPAVRSCWASAFAVDPLARAEACCLPPEALALGVLVQPEIRPAAGGVARVTGAEVIVEGVRGHPGALLSGWAEGASARVRLPAPPRGAGRRPGAPGQAAPDGAAELAGQPGADGLCGLLGPRLVAAVAALAGQAWQLLGDDVIEWAAAGGRVWLLQSLRSGVTAGAATGEPAMAGQAAPERVTAGQVTAGQDAAALAGGGPTASRARMPLLAAAVLGQGEHVPGRPGAPGTAAGWLVACRPHERPAGDCGDAILLVDQPLPALAPLLFGARGVIARTGTAGAHLAQVARSLGVPMVLGCRPERVTGPPPVPDGAFLVAIDGSTGDVAFVPAAAGDDRASHLAGSGALTATGLPFSLPGCGRNGQRS